MSARLRMLDWTGERFLPWAKEATVAYEHLHRYLWASHLVREKRVLDLACGEGYGANILAEHASSVCGVDIDGKAVEHAGQKYRRPNLRFLRGDVTNVPIPDHSFDVIVCFEAIEHIEQHDGLMREVVRLLQPGGIFIVSTPNKNVYRTGPEEPNPFHVKELTFTEFNALLSGSFANVRYFGQQVHPGSTLWPIGVPDELQVREFAVARTGQEFQRLRPDERIAKYFVAVAGNGALEVSAGSVLIDHSDELIQEKDRERDLLQEQVNQRDEALAWRAGQVDVLEREKKELLEGIELVRKDAEALRDELAAIHASRSWKLISKLRGLRERVRLKSR